MPCICCHLCKSYQTFGCLSHTNSLSPPYTTATHLSSRREGSVRGGGRVGEEKEGKKKGREGGPSSNVASVGRC